MRHRLPTPRPVSRRALPIVAVLLVAALSSAASSASAAELISRASGTSGAKGQGQSVQPATSADGRFVAFASMAPNLVPEDGDTTFDVFVRDRVAQTTELVSQATGVDGPKGDGSSLVPSISADGRLVAFYSEAGNLGAGTSSGQIFVRDLVLDTTTVASRASGATGAVAETIATHPAISANGQCVAFATRARNLGADGESDNGDIFVRDLKSATTTLVSRATGRDGNPGNDDSGHPSISGNGKRVAFETYALNLAKGGTNGEEPAIALRNLKSHKTMLVSRASGRRGEPGAGASFRPVISGDGSTVAFGSDAGNLAKPEPGDKSYDVFARDLEEHKTVQLSRHFELPPGTHLGKAVDPSISSNGKRVAFSVGIFEGVGFSNAGRTQVFLGKSDSGRPSPAPEALGVDDSESSLSPSISGDGRFLTFQSEATDLTPDDPDVVEDIYGVGLR